MNEQWHARIFICQHNQSGYSSLVAGLDDKKSGYREERLSPVPHKRHRHLVFSFSTAMSILIANNPDPHILRSVVNHVFMPPKLPQEDPSEQMEQSTNVALCDKLLEAAREFFQYVPTSQRSLWMHMIKMMELIRGAAEVPLEEASLQHVISSMAIGGMSM